MSRFSALRSCLLRHNHPHRSLFRQPQQPQHHLNPISRSLSSISFLISPLKNALPSSISMPVPFSTLAISATASASLSSPTSTQFRSYSSDAELPSNMVLVKSEDQLKDWLKKTADESSPAVFYFTAVWCGPCRFIWPEIEKLSKSLPGVKFYKIDIDEVGAGPTLSNLSILSVPTLHFFKNGKKAAEVVGADAKRIKDISSSLYNNGSAE